MALNRASLERYHIGPVVGKQPGRRLIKWMYGSPDGQVEILNDNYFNGVEFEKGHVVEVVSNFEAVPKTFILVVLSVEDSVVTVGLSE